MSQNSFEEAAQPFISHLIECNHSVPLFEKEGLGEICIHFKSPGKTWYVKNKIL